MPDPMIPASPPRIAVIGLGYVGLPLAVALARSFPTLGLDIDGGRIEELRRGLDRTGEIDPGRLAASTLEFASEPGAATGRDIYIVTVPTPVDSANVPDLGPLTSATRTVAGLLEAGRGTIVVYESTVYPGVTEDHCGRLLEELSGLRRGHDFFLGYSPERINPGDREHTVDRIVKVVAGETEAVARRLAEVYGAVTTGGIFVARSIKTAEAAKVIENSQRDINIAFVNEITRVFHDIGVSVWDVLDAAGTKWNFLPFKPGLVGGHCIGVDPFYLSHLAQKLGHDPRVILSGRATNDSMSTWIADTLHSQRRAKAGSALVMGLTFKENVPDLRNSKVADLVRRLAWLGHRVTVHDPMADPGAARHEHGIELDPDALGRSYDLVVMAVAHEDYGRLDEAAIAAMVAPGGLLADIKALWRDRALPGVARWSF